MISDENRSKEGMKTKQIYWTGSKRFATIKKEGNLFMKKLLAIVLSVVMVLGFAVTSMAIEPLKDFPISALPSSPVFMVSGEVNTEANLLENSTQTEVGLYNLCKMSDSVLNYVGFWGAACETYTYFVIEEAFSNIKFGNNNNLLIGYNRYNIYSSLDVLGNGYYLMNLMGGYLQPNAQAVLSVPIGRSFTAKAGYFPYWLNKSSVSHNAVSLGGVYTAGPITVDATYLYLSKGDDTAAPKAEYIINADYKLGEKVKAYVAYAGVNGAEANVDIENYAFVGA